MLVANDPAIFNAHTCLMAFVLGISRFAFMVKSLSVAVHSSGAQLTRQCPDSFAAGYFVRSASLTLAVLRCRKSQA